MRMISRLSFTSMRRNGCVADQLSLASRSAKRASARMGQEGPHAVGRAGQEQVDSLGRQQDGAHEVQGLGAGAQVFTQRGAVVYAYELVGRDIQNLLHGARL
jgi:hypothetical protein